MSYALFHDRVVDGAVMTPWSLKSILQQVSYALFHDRVVDGAVMAPWSLKSILQQLSYALFHDHVVDGAVISAVLSINLLILMGLFLTPWDANGHWYFYCCQNLKTLAFLEFSRQVLTKNNC